MCPRFFSPENDYEENIFYETKCAIFIGNSFIVGDITYNLRDTFRVLHGRNKDENGIFYNFSQKKGEKNWSKFSILHLPHLLALIRI